MPSKQGRELKAGDWVVEIVFWPIMSPFLTIKLSWEKIQIYEKKEKSKEWPVGGRGEREREANKQIHFKGVSQINIL